MTHKGTVYLSGPITGLTYGEARYGWRQEVVDRLAPGIVGLSPMRHEGHLAELKQPLEATSDQAGHFFSGSKIIVEKDKLDIERSDIMLVNVLGATQRVSIGTAVEIGIAMILGKKIILVIEDPGTAEIGAYFDEYGNKWPIKGDNIHDHPFITVPASLRLNNLDDAIYAINSLLSEGL